MVALILGAKARGHRAYQHLDEQSVRAKAQILPVNGVPPELLNGLPDDKSLDNIQIHKTVTPVEGMHHYLERARDSFREQGPLAVVLEGSASDAMDISMRRVHALKQLTRDLSGGPEVEYTNPTKARVGKHDPAMVRD